MGSSEQGASYQKISFDSTPIPSLLWFSPLFQLLNKEYSFYLVEGFYSTQKIKYHFKRFLLPEVSPAVAWLGSLLTPLYSKACPCPPFYFTLFYFFTAPVIFLFFLFGWVGHPGDAELLAAWVGKGQE